MGQVHRATDTALDRQVAIKVLPESFALDAERVARFTREAKTLASLNHPNIAGIYGIEQSGGTRALVMELVEGEDLSAILARGPVPVSDARHGRHADAGDDAGRRGEGSRAPMAVVSSGWPAPALSGAARRTNAGHHLGDRH